MMRRVLAMILVFAMCLSMMPVSVMAEDGIGDTEVTGDLPEIITEPTAEPVVDAISAVPEEPAPETFAVVEWSWVGGSDAIENGVLALTGTSADSPALLGDVTALLPIAVSCEHGELSVRWSCADYPADGAYEGEYVFTAVLPEGYALAEGAAALCITVTLGGAVPAPEKGDEPAAVSSDVLYINAENFPDANFRAYIAEVFDTAGVGYLTADQVAAVTSIDCSERNISDLTGIEHFTKITILSCSNNNLTELDVSNCKSLTRLSCGRNNLSKLDVSNNTALKSLACENNEIITLNVTNNAALQMLYCYGNALNELNLRALTALTELYCSSNALTSLDISANTALRTLECGSNHLQVLDVSKNSELAFLSIGSNQLAELDLTANTKVKTLLCPSNRLTTLELGGLSELTQLGCNNNHLSHLDLSGNPQLSMVTCRDQGLVLTAELRDGSYVVDLAALVGSDNLDKISGVTGGEFDAATGLISMNKSGNGSETVTVAYSYDPQYAADPGMRMDVTLTVTMPEDAGDAITQPFDYDVDYAARTATITGLLTEVSGVLTIPATIDEWTVKAIGSRAFEDCTDLTEVVLPEGLCYLGDYAFAGCTSLASVTLPSTLSLLSYYAFMGCSALESISIPDRVTAVGESAFANCVQLSHVTLGSGIRVIGAGAFGGCTALESITLPAGVTTLENFAFAESGLNTITFRGSAPSFNGEVFLNVTATAYYPAGDESWTTDVRQSYGGSITWEETEGEKLYINAENFPDAAFRAYITEKFDTEGKGYLSEGQLANVTEIRCDGRNISDLTGLEHFTALKSLSCRNNPITTLDLSGYTALTYLQDAAFAGCTQLQTVVLPQNLVALGYYTFYGCSSLQNISIPGSVGVVAESTFGNCSSLASVTLGSGIRVIGASAFGGCSALRSITIPASVVTVESNAFAESGLNTIIFEGSAPAFGLNIFQGVTAVAKYPAASSGWTADVLQNYGGSISWQTVGEGFIDGKLYINEQNFPDGDFRTYISNTFDTAGVGYLTTEQVDAVTQIYCIYKGIDTLTGIEHFRNLEYLNCGSNQIRHLDLSRNNALKELYCGSNGMETLDVSGCLELEYLHCSYNELTELNLNGCAYLTSLSCDNNALTSLDLSGCTALQFVNCYDNELTELSLSGCASLQELNCYSNKLAALNISGCTALQRLACEYNELTELSLSGFAQLNHLSCTSNKLQTLNIGGCTALQYLDCGFNDIAELDISGCTQLNSIRCAGNELEVLDVSALTLLDNLECSNNRLPLLDLSGDHVYLDYVYGWGQDAGSRQAELKSGSFVLDMAKVVGAENIARVRNVTGGSYDADTGLITLRRTGTALSIPVSYQFDTGRDDVEFTVTLEAMLPLNLSGSCGDNVTWSFDDGVLTISGSGPMYNYGQSIYAFGGSFPWQQWPELVRSLVVEEGVTAIGKGAFEGCTALTEVSLPNSLKSIGITAFSSCEALETIRLPEGLETIGDQAFYCAYKLRSVNIPSTVTYIGDGAFSDTALEEVFFLADVQRFNRCFSYCKNLKTVVIRDGMFAITGEAFRGCTALESVTIPASVELIDPWAFEGCTALKELIIAEDNPAFSFKDGALLSKDGKKLIAYIGNGTQVSVPVGVEVIGKRAFAEKSRLTSVRLPFTVKSIEQDAFFNCSKLESVHLNEGLETIGDMAFYSCGLTSITLPRSLKSLGSEAFSNCYDLYDIRMSGVGDHLMLKDGVLYSADGTILHMALAQLEGEFIVPAGVKHIGDHAFEYQHNLWSVTLPNGLETIGSHAFHSVSIQTIDLPASLREIGAYAFANTQIQDWVIPVGITVKGGLSFVEGWAARKILFLGSAPGALLESRDFEIYLENAVVYYPADDPSWSESARESLHAEGVTWVGYSSAGLCGSGLTWMLDDNGLLRISGSGAMADYSVSSPAPWGSAVRSVIVEDGVSYIGSCAFVGCDNLSSVIFEGCAPAIADDAFSGVEATVSYPFADSSWTDELLTNYGGSLSWAEDGPNGVSDYGAAWSLRDGVLTVTAGSNGSGVPDYEPGQAPWYAYRDSITSVVFGPGMQTIGSNAFADLAALTSVTMPMVGTGWFIYGDAFANCTALEEITLPFGGEGSISDNAFSGCSALSKINLLGAEPTLEDNAFTGITATVTYPSHWEIIPGHDYGGSLSWVAREQEGGSCGENAVWTYENGVLTISGSGPMADYRDPMMMSDGRDFAPWSGLRNNVTSVVVGEGITHIGENAFNRFFHIKSVSLPDGLESISIGAFGHCYALTSFDIPETVTEIGAGAFMNCSSLTSLELPAGITEIPDNLVGNCPSLATIHIPEGVTSIGSMAFGGCYGLKEVTLPASVTKIADRAFWMYTAISAIHVDEDNRCFSSVDGVLYNKDRTELIKCPEEKRGEVTIPASVTKLHYEAFADCNLLEVITFAGSAPEIIDYGRQFRGVSAIIRYPAGDGSWDELVGNNYQGMLLWKEYTPVVTKLHINAENFPDANFRAYISDTFDTEGVGYLTAEQVDAVFEIRCSNLEIADLTGIGYFHGLGMLDCSFNTLTALDVSLNTELTHLNCRNNALTDLDVSELTQLYELDCSWNPLGELDVSSNPTIVDLYCVDTGLTEIDVSMLPDLRSFHCSENFLTELDLSANSALVSLGCYGNSLTELDLSANTQMNHLNCSNNKLRELDLSGPVELYTLNCSGNELFYLELGALTELYEFEGNGQKIACTAEVLDGRNALGMIALIGRGDPFRISDVVGGRYESANGHLILPETVIGPATTTVIYKYDPQYVGDSTARMDVTLTVTVLENTAKRLYINEENFPDAAFRAYISETFDTAQLGYLTEQRVAAVTEIDCSGKGISDLTGVEHFAELTSLDCSMNNLSKLDVSANTKLVYLFCGDNALSALDVSANAELTALYCYMNNIAVLDVSRNTALTEFSCAENDLAELDVSANTALTKLICDENSLTELDVSRNAALTTLVCAGNGLTELDVSKNAALETLNCSNTLISSLDVSGNTALHGLYCSETRLTELDVSANTGLWTLYCGGNELSVLDLSANTELNSLECNDNALSSLDLRNNSRLGYVLLGGQETALTAEMHNGRYVVDLTDVVGEENLGRISAVTGGSYDAVSGVVTLQVTVGAETTVFGYCYDTGCTAEDSQPMDVTVTVELSEDSNLYINAENFPDAAFRAYISETFDIEGVGYLTAEQVASVTEIDCSSRGIADMTGLEHFTELKTLRCIDNSLTALDISKNSALTSLNCTANHLATLDVSGCTELMELSVSGNSLKMLDVSKNVALLSLHCGDNELTVLNLSCNPELQTLSCGSNQLSALDVSNNLKLCTLMCERNRISELDISKNSRLDMLSCDENDLTALNLSGQGELTFLSCTRNKLSTLDVSDCSKLEALYCGGNLLAALDVSANTALQELCCGSAADESDPSQKPGFTAWLRDGKYWLDLAGALGEEDLSRVSNIAGGRIDEETGLVILTVSPGADAAAFGYDYDPGYTAEEGKVMHADAAVTLKVDTNLYINEKNFPDTAFRAYISGTFDTEGVGYLTAEQVTSVTEIDCSFMEIADLTGIGHFTALEILNCAGNNLTSLDASANKTLLTLNCYNNKITDLDVSGCTELESLECNYNQLSTLDISKNTALKELICQVNSLTELDVSANTALETLVVSVNSLSVLDLSANVNLTYLSCESQEISLDAEILNGRYVVDVAALAGNGDLDKISGVIGGTYDAGTGLVTLPETVVGPATATVIYKYDPQYAGDSTARMDVTLTVAVPAPPVEYKLYINAENFPDAAFRAYISETFDPEGVGYLTAEQVAGIQEINCYGCNISSLSGIEHFTALTVLKCGGNNLGSLNVGENKALKKLCCEYGGVKTLDVSGNTELEELLCYGNELKTLDVGKNKKLTVLQCDYNQLTALNVSANTALQVLRCSCNALKTLNISANTALTELDCNNNNLAALDVSTNTALTVLKCSSNALKALDVSRNTALTKLECAFNELQTLDISANTALTYMDCGFNGLQTLDVSAHTDITNLYCGSNALSELDVSANTALQELFCDNNALTSLDVSRSGRLSSLSCTGNDLTALDLSKNAELSFLGCYDNALVSLDVSGCSALVELQCYNNALTGLDLRPNTAIWHLDCRDNALIELKVEGCSALESLNCEGNALTELDVSGCTSLTHLACGGNKLEALDVSDCAMLFHLDCCGNRIGELDVSACAELAELNCEGNALMSLHLADCPAMSYLVCKNQTATVELASAVRTIDMAALVGSENLGQISKVTGGSYDAATGLITLPDSVVGPTTVTVTYMYDPQAAHDSAERMNVTLTVTVARDMNLYINAENFPDAAFRAYISETFDPDGNGYMTPEEVAEVTRIDCSSREIKKMTGIEHFTELKSLSCYCNSITALDVSGLGKLESLSCEMNQLKTLDVSGCTKLETLRCYQNAIGLLDLSNNPALKVLDVSANQLTALDVSACAKLEELGCSANSLTALDVSRNPALQSLSCGMNRLSALNVSGCTALNDLDCGHNSLAELDVSTLGELSYLNCETNNLTGLDVSANSKLENLNCSDNSLTALDVTSNPLLEQLYAGRNKTGSLDVASNPALKVLDVSGNNLTTLDVSANTNLESLGCSNNNLSVLDVSRNPKLDNLSCGGNNLAALDVSQNSDLRVLSCENNSLTVLDISANSRLEILSCTGNRLSTLDVSVCPELWTLHCGGNLFATLDVSANSKLQEFSCGSANDAADPSQKPVFTAWLRDDNYWLDLAGALGEEDLSRVSNITGGRIDEETGLVIVAGSHGTVSMTLGYDYDPACTTMDGKLMHADAVVMLKVDTNLYINEKNFPDAAFRAYISATFDSERVGYLTVEQVAAVTELYCPEMNIQDITGVEHFSNLQVLNCQVNAIKSIDVSRNTALLRLDCSHNALTELDVSGNAALENLDCFSNELAKLDISGCRNLVSVDCRWNKLTELNVSGSAALKTLLCSSNLLTALELSANTTLEALECEKNKLEALDVSANKALRILNCNWNALTKLDVSGNTALTSLSCGANELTELDVSTLSELETLDCGKNQLSTLDVSENTKLSGYFGCYENHLTSLDLSCNGAFGMMECFGQTTGAFAEIRNGKYVVDMAALLVEEKLGKISVVSGGIYDAATGLVTLTVTGGSETAEFVYHYDLSYAGDESSRMDVTVAVELTEDTNLYINAVNFPDAAFRAYIRDTFDTEGVGYLTVEQVAEVTEISAASLGIKDIAGVEHFHALRYLDCSGNALTTLDVSANTALEMLLCSGNSLSGLDMSVNTGLTQLNCADNALTALNVSRNTQLKSLHCGDNALAKLDVSRNTALMALNVSGNALTTLDVSRNGALTELVCDNNKIAKLDLSKNTALRSLNCSSNALASLSVSQNVLLDSLNCGNNPLGKLDVNANTALRELRCSNSGLAELNLAANAELEELHCDGNALTVLDLSHNPALSHVDCGRNSLAMLDASGNTALADKLYCGEQSPVFNAALDSGKYVLDLAAIVGAENLGRIGHVVGGIYDAESGILTLAAAFGADHASLAYEYSVELSSGAVKTMDVSAYVKLPDLNQKCGDDLYWSYSQRTGTLTITGTGDMWNFAETGAPWYDLREGISAVKLPVGMTSIGDHAFTDCRIKKVDVPAHVNYVGKAAFHNNPISNIYFTGNAPLFASDAFVSLNANAHYPVNDLDWTEDVRQNYGGDIHWVTLDNDNVVSGRCGPTTRWALKKNGTLTISGLGEVTDAPWREYGESIVKVVVEKGVSSIPGYAFWSFNSPIKSISLPEGLERIGNYAFSNCSKLTSLTIPASVTHIGEAAFRNCSGLKGFTLASGSRSFRVENGVLYNYAGTTMICCPSGYKGQLTVPYGVTKLEPLAVYGCSQLTGVSLPDSLTEIGSWNFYACAKLKEVTIPENVEFIGELTFSGCESLHMIEFTGDVPVVEVFPYVDEGYSLVARYPLNNPTWTEEARDAISTGCIWEGVERDYSGVGSCGSNLTWTVQDGVLHIYGSGAMDSFVQAPWYSLRHGIFSVVVEEGVGSISAGAFRGCTSISSVTLPAEMPGYTFSNGALYEGATLHSAIGSMKEFAVPETVDAIGAYAFAESGVTAVDISSSVQSIHTGAFAGCVQLENVYLRGNMPVYIESDAFAGVKADVFYRGDDPSFSEDRRVNYGGELTWKPFNIISGHCGEGLSWTLDDWGTLTISGEGVLDAADWGEYAGRIVNVVIGSGVQGADAVDFSGCVNLRAFEVDADSSFHAAVDGILYDKSMTALLSCPEVYTGELRIPEGVFSIGELAFTGCKKLTGVFIPASVSEIPTGAFGWCSALVSVEVAKENENFVSVDNLLYDSELETLLVCPAGLGGEIIPVAVSIIADSAFAGCRGLTAVNFPDGLVYIGESAFCDCSALTHLDFPETLETIGNLAFWDCGSVTDIVFHGSAPTIETHTFCGVTAAVSYNHMDESWNEHIGRHYGGSLDWNSMVRASGEMAGFKWVLDNYGKLTISGNGSMPDFAWNEDSGSGAPWSGYSNEILTVIVGEGITHIGGAAFAGCESLTEVSLPASLSTIGNYAFLSSGLAELIIPGAVQAIGAEAFGSCDFLRVDIPASVSVIADRAFADNSGLQAVIIRGGVCELGENIFSGSRNLTIYGDSGSSAEDYADKHRIPFALLEAAPPVLEGIRLSEEHVKLPVGGKVKLTVNPIPSNAILPTLDNWYISSSAVAAVGTAGGATLEISAVNPGSAKVYVTGGSFGAACELEVLPVLDEIILPETLELAVGTEKNIAAEFLPYGAYLNDTVWKSSSEKVLSIIEKADGSATLVGNKAGSATVTVTNGKIKASMKVTVLKQVAEAIEIYDSENVRVDGMTLYFQERSGHKIDFSAIVRPDNSDSKLKWSSDNGQVASVDQKGRVNIKKAGMARITVRATDAESVCNSFLVVVMDCEPRLSAAKLSINSFFTDGSVFSVSPAEDCRLVSVELVQKSNGGEYLPLEEIHMESVGNGSYVLYHAPLQKASYSAFVKTESYNAYLDETLVHYLPLKLTVTNSKPSVKMAVSAINAYYGNLSWAVTPTVKNAVLESYVLAADSSPYFELDAAGRIVLSAAAKTLLAENPNARINQEPIVFEVSCANAAESIRVSVKPSVVYKQPSVKITLEKINVYYSADTWAVMPAVTNGELAGYRLAPDSSPYFELNGAGRLIMTQAARDLLGESKIAAIINKEPIIFEVLFRDAEEAVRVSVKPGVIYAAPSAKLSVGKINWFYRNAVADVAVTVKNGELAFLQLASDSSPFFELTENGQLRLNERGRDELEANSRYRFTEPVIFRVAFAGTDSVSTISIKPSVINTAPKLQLRNAEGKAVSTLTYSSFFDICEAEVLIWDVTNGCAADISAASVDNEALTMELNDGNSGEAVLRWNGSGKLGKVKLYVESPDWTRTLTLNVTTREEKQPTVSFSQSGKLDLVRRDLPVILVPKLSNAIGADIESIRLLSAADAKGNDCSENFVLAFNESSLRAELMAKENVQLSKQKYKLSVATDLCIGTVRSTVVSTVTVTPTQSKLTVKTTAMTMDKGESALQILTLQPEGVTLSDLYAGSLPAGVSAQCNTEKGEILVSVGKGAKAGSHTLVFYATADGAQSGTAATKVSVKLKIN